MSISTSDKANPGMRFRFAARHSVLLSLFVVLFGAGATAFADSRVGFNDPLSNFLISGEYYMWGWALFDTQPVTSVQITVGNNVPAYAHYGDPRPDVCNNGLTTWVGCNAGTSNVGWDLTANTAAMTQGPGQTVTVLAAPLSGMSQSTNVTVDQPPTMTLTSTPSAGSGNGKFTFTVNTATSMLEYQGLQPWINGMIAASLGSNPACSFSYFPDAYSFALTDNSGNWQWGNLASGLSNSACTINPDSSYTQTSNTSGVLTLDIAFNSGLQGTNEQIWMITQDDWLQSEWQFARSWNTEGSSASGPAISSLTPVSGPPGTLVWVYGSGFGGYQGSSTITFGGAAGNVEGWTSTYIMAYVPSGAVTGPIVVTVNGAQATSSTNFTVTPPPVLSIDALPLVISGTYGITGWALDQTTPINGSSVQVTVGSVANTATYGLYRSDACTAYPGWPGCPNVGWSASINTLVLPQAQTQTVTVTASDEDAPPLSASAISSVAVDQPPSIALASVPPAGSGSGFFTFTATSASSAQNLQWINGVISSVFNTLPECSFSYFPSSGALALNDESGNWTWGVLGSSINNNECQINADSTYSSNGMTGTLSLDIIFLSGLSGAQQIWGITSDAPSGASWLLQSPWQELATNWSPTLSQPSISGFAPTSAPQGTPLTIYGSNLGNGPGTVTLGGALVSSANITSWSATSIALTVPANAASGVVSVAATTGTATSGSQFQFVPPDFSMGTPSPSTVTAYPTGNPSGSFTETISGANFTGLISLASSGQIGLSFSPQSLFGPGTFTATATAPWGTPAGPYNVTVTASGFKSDGTPVSHQISVPVTVTGPPTIIMSSPSPSPVIVSSGQNVTFTQTITGVNGAWGAVTFTPTSALCFGGNTNIPPVTLPNVANPTAIVTGTIQANSGLVNSAVNQCPVTIGNLYLPQPPNAPTVYVPVQLTSAGTVTVSGPSAVTLYVGAAGPTTVDLLVSPVNGFSNYVTLASTTPSVSVLSSSTSVSAPTNIPVSIQWTFSAPPPSNPIPISIMANGQSVFTIYATVLPNPGSTFTLTSTPASQSTNSSGVATFQINVNASSSFIDTVSFSVAGLPTGSYTNPAGVAGVGATALTVTPPAVTTTTLYTITVTGKDTSNSSNQSAVTLYLTQNPLGAAAPATMLLPEPSPGKAPILPLYYPTYTWTPAVRATQLNLSVGRSKGGTEFGSTPLGPSTTQFKQQVSLACDGSEMWVRLGSFINGTWQNNDYSYTSQCHGGGNDTEPFEATLETDVSIATIKNNGVPSSYSFYPDPTGAGGYQFSIGAGCYAQTSGGVLVPGLTGFPSYPDPTGDNGFSVAFQANETVASGTYDALCNWVPPYQTSPEDFTADIPLVTGAPQFSHAMLQVYDATPFVSDTNLPSTFAGDQSYTTLLVINGANFGTHGALVFCQSGTTCDPQASDPNISYQVASGCPGGSCWTPGEVAVWLATTQDASGSYEVMVVSGGVGSSGFLAAPGAGAAAAQSNQKPGPNVPCYTPTNLRPISGTGDRYGRLTMKYLWDSTSGNPSDPATGAHPDLVGCSIEEVVAYPTANAITSNGQPAYQAVSPPFPANAIFPYPTVVAGPASSASFSDTHSLTGNSVPPNFVQPYSAQSFNAFQTFLWKCSCAKSGTPPTAEYTEFPNWIRVPIVRSIAQNPDQTWNYTITESGFSATINQITSQPQ